MKKVVIYLLSLIFAACAADEESFVPEFSAFGMMQDKEGNTYQWVRIDTLDWMAENLHCGIRWYRQGTVTNPKFSYSDSTICALQFEIFGNYYSYTEALAQCPDGWRLPTDNDWKCLERAYGMSAEEVDKTGWRKGAARLLAQNIGAEAGMNLQFGGELAAFFSSDVELYHVYDYGLYWSSTLDTLQMQKCAYIRKITPAVDAVQRVATPTSTKWMSVRYVRTAQ